MTQHIYHIISPKKWKLQKSGRDKDSHCEQINTQEIIPIISVLSLRLRWEFIMTPVYSSPVAIVRSFDGRLLELKKMQKKKWRPEQTWGQFEGSCLHLQLYPPHKGFKKQMCFPTLGNWIIATTRTSMFWPS